MNVLKHSLLLHVTGSAILHENSRAHKIEYYTQCQETEVQNINSNNLRHVATISSTLIQAHKASRCLFNFITVWYGPQCGLV